MNTKQLSIVLDAILAGLMLAGCSSPAPVAITETKPAPATTSRPVTTPVSSPTPDLDATRGAEWGATLQAGQTQNAAYQATSSVQQTEASEERATSQALTPISLALTPTRTPEPPANPTAIPEKPITVDWKETIPIPDPSSAPFDTLRGQGLIFHNGYVYIFGGRSASDERLTNVYFSAIKPDGILAGWMETTSLPGKYYDHVVVKTGNYVYLLTGAAGVKDVYYAPVNADSSIGAWKMTNSLSPSRQDFAAASYGNFIYATGGNSGGVQDFVQFTSVKPDGSLNSWSHTIPLPVAIQEHAMIAYDGYLYVLGGLKETNERVTTVYSSAINSDGTLAKWKTTTPLPHRTAGFSAFEANGFVYLLGGGSSAYYARILEDHTLGIWQTVTALPALRHGLRAGAYNGYAYAMGGYDLASYQSTVYYGWIGFQKPEENPVVEHPDCTSGWTRLAAGDQAKVSEDTTLPNRVRAGPSRSEEIVTLLDPGSIVRVIEGPVCAGGLVFWRVESDAIPGGVGWTAEGDGSEYYLEPYKP